MSKQTCNNPSYKETPGWDGFIGKFYLMLKKDEHQFSTNSSTKRKREYVFPKVLLLLIPKDITGKEN